MFLLLTLPAYNYLHAENMLVDGNIFYTIPDAGGSDKFHTGKVATVNFNYYYRPWLALSAGIFISEEIFDNSRTDIVGTYQASAETQGITIGLRPEYQFSKRNGIYARTGFLFYNTKISVSEFFEPGLPSGTVSDNTDGNGYYLAAGWKHAFTNTVSFQLELAVQKQLDLFKGKADPDSVFDLSYPGFSLGLGYAF